MKRENESQTSYALRTISNEIVQKCVNAADRVPTFYCSEKKTVRKRDAEAVKQDMLAEIRNQSINPPRAADSASQTKPSQQ